MIILIIKLMLLLFGIALSEIEGSVVLPVVSFLSALVISMLCQYIEERRFTIVCICLYFVVCIWFPLFFAFIPLLCLDLFLQENYFAVVLAFVALVLHISDYRTEKVIFIVLLIMCTFLMKYMNNKIESLAKENKLIRDNSREQNRKLEQKNKELMEKQDYEIHLAELNERNRIAREIHDNVGHMLTSSILQTGALLTINKDKDTSKRLNEIKKTLSTAMDSIRESVHNLKSDSIDLYDAIMKMCQSLSYNVNVDYDVDKDMDSNIKYCIIAILKEAVTNITKHSNATGIDIKVQEHPFMYQLLIQDNGTKRPVLQEGGIGLINIEERVKNQGGNFTHSYKNGFRIFITIPKGGTTL